MLEKYIQKADPKSFPFACCRCIVKDSKTIRCGKATHYTLVIGANQITTPYCEDCLREMGYLHD